MTKTIVVGMADLNVCTDPNLLTTYGLGSCVGVALYDATTRIAGMAHIMLPNANQPNLTGAAIAKFGDTAIPELLRRMLNMGASKNHMIAKLAGGAHMFSSSMTTDIIKVGQRNVAVSQEVLQRLRIPIRAEDTGGTFGRTIELNAANGALLIKTIGHGSKTI